MTVTGPAARLHEHAQATPDAVLFEYPDDTADGPSLTYAELDAAAAALAGRIRRLARPGDRVVVLEESGPQFAVGLFACFRAGVIAVPLCPPDARRPGDRLSTVVRDADPALLLVAARNRRAVRDWLATGAAGPRRVLLIDDPDEPAAGAAPDVAAVAAEEPALLQYTSGSTGDPAGVVVTSGNLVANVEQIRRAFRLTPDTVLVNWLPLFHDMGLLAMVLTPALAGLRSVQLAPGTFVRRPRRWLELISGRPDVGTMAPDFGYRHCVQRIPADRRDGLDLSGWRIAGTGSEPVRAGTLADFAAAFADQGFPPDAFRPSYGLAEATVLVCAAGGGPRTLAVDRAALGAGRVEPARSGTAAVVVSCGAPAGQAVQVVDPDTGIRCGPGEIGELWVSGPNVAAGYFRQPGRTGRTFVDDRDGRRWLRTGDLGFADGGEVFVAGRIKDLVILDGRNHHPADLEQTVERAHPAIASGGVVATSVDGPAGEALVLLVELSRAGVGDEVVAAVRRAVAEQHAVTVRDVVPLRRGTLPRTTSGKVRRAEGRRLYLGGALVPGGGRELAGATR